MLEHVLKLTGCRTVLHATCTPPSPTIIVSAYHISSGVRIPTLSTDVYLVERLQVQRRFFGLLTFYTRYSSCVAWVYSPIAEHLNLNLNTLVDRRIALGAKFLKNLLNGKVDSPSLLSLINWTFPRDRLDIMLHSLSFLYNQSLNLINHLDVILWKIPMRILSLIFRLAYISLYSAYWHFSHTHG